MSTPAERIREAAERDEAAAFTAPEGSENEPEPETEEEAETEATEPEPETPAEPTGEPVSDLNLSTDQAAEMDKALQAYVRRIGKVFGGELPPECAACNGLGFDLFGGEAAPEFRAHEHYIGCDECDAMGKVLTGSHVPNFDLADCPKCQGRGFLEKMAAPAAVPDAPSEYGTPAWMGTPQPGQP